MRVILSGQRSFGAAALEAINGSHDVVRVWAPEPDDRLAKAAQKLGITCSKNSTPEKVKLLNVDLIVCAHSHAFIGQQTRGATKLGAIGYHPSLLPRHRGRDAVRWTIKMGDPIAGGSVYWLNDNVDAGPIAASQFCFVKPGWTHHELWSEELFPMGIRLLQRVLKDLDNGIIVEADQDETVATWEPSWGREPLFRPELPELGSGPEGYVVIKKPE